MDAEWNVKALADVMGISLKMELLKKKTERHPLSPFILFEN